jgi:dipeptidyl aminopeptidase/acylaminoacyl peptidase
MEFTLSRSSAMFVTSLMKKILIVGGLLLMFISLSHAEAISPRRLLGVADLSGPVISPDGNSVAFRLEQASVERNTYDIFWYVQAMDGKSPSRRIADGGILLHDTAGVSVPGHAVWSPDGRWIYYRALVDGQMAVWRAAVDGSGAEPVTHDPADVRDFALSADGRTLKYSVGATRDEVIAAEQAEYDRGIHIDDTVPVGQGGLFRSGNIDGRLETQRFRMGASGWGRVQLLTEVPDQWKAIDLETRKTGGLSPSERTPQPPTTSDISNDIRKALGMPLLEPSPPWKLAADPDTGRIALLTRIGNGKGLMRKPDVQLAMLPKAGSTRPIKCQAELCVGKAISAIHWRPHSDEVLFTVTDPHEGQAQSIYRWNVRTGTVHLVTQSAGLLNGGRDSSSACGISSEALVCVAAEADRPPRLERIDLITGRRQVLFDPNAALALDMTKTAPSRLLRWKDAKGQEFTGQFFPAQRRGHGPSPLFVTYYVCTGFLRGGLGDEWPLASLAEKGISALCINKAPYRLDAVERYGQGLSAVKSIIDILALKGEVDRTKVGMGGLSFGTEVTLWTAMKSDLLTAASVTSVAMSRNYYLFSSMRGNAFFKELQEFWQLGALDKTPERWRLLSPAANLDTIKAPILMQMPEQEYVVALDYAIPLIRAHRADLYVFPNEPHQKFQPKHKLAAYERNVDWFRFWLQGYEDPNPVKKQQYVHWREMRDAVSTKSARSGARSGG